MKQTNKHILFSVAWYPNKSGKLCSSFVQNHAKAISNYCKLSVIGVFSSPYHKHISIERNIVNQNLVEYLVYTPELNVEKSLFNKILAGILYYISYLLGLISILKNEGRFSLVHVNVLTRAGVIPLLIKKAFNIPYIISEHWTRYYPNKAFPNSKLHLKLSQTIVREAQTILCAANAQIEAMKTHDLSNPNYFKFKNTIDTSIFKPLGTNATTIPHFVTVALFRDKAKNLSGILNVLAQLKESGHQFTYSFIGDGPDFQTIKSKAKEYNLDNVSFLGYMNAKDISFELNKATCSILFSNHENQPVSIIESLACGTPVIATKVGDVKEMLPKGCGEIINAKDEKALYRKIEDIITQKTHLSPQTCINEAEQYSFEKVGQEFYNIYLKIDL